MNANQHYQTASSDRIRASLKSDLIGHVLHDDPGVFRRLRIDGIDNKFVGECVDSLRVDKKADIDILKELVRIADGVSLDRLEIEEAQSRRGMNVGSKNTDYGMREEEKMYDPLVRLFSYITKFKQAETLHRVPKRNFQRTTGKLEQDFHKFGFSCVNPDLDIIRHAASGGGPRHWGDRDSFGELKPSSKQGPKAGGSETVPEIVLQCADYARLLMTSRPFMLFCTGLLIFGTKFCVGIFDREGITFSPINDMFEDMEVLVRVIQSITHQLLIQELGLDPTVRVLTTDETTRLTGQRPDYPSALVTVTPTGLSSTQWCTIGVPIWTSLSLLGRGTNVWQVREYYLKEDEQTKIAEYVLEENIKILKTSWRSSSRTSESDIYHHLHSILPNLRGIVRFECGGDVVFSDTRAPTFGKPITVENMRSHPICSDIVAENGPTLVLHRLILETVGYHMWDYKDDLQLLRGFRDALLAHKTLSENGILHRDISPGNVLLTDPGTDGLYGVITDIEYARIDANTIVAPHIAKSEVQGDDPTQPTQRIHIRYEGTVDVKRGAHMTGTAQFMARELLMNYISGVKHEVHHDIESFIWVLLYCVMRHLSNKASAKGTPENIRAQGKAFLGLYKDAFGRTSIEDIAKARLHDSPAIRFLFGEDENIQELVATLVSEPLRRLVIVDFWTLLHKATFHPVFEAVPLTYAAILGPTNVAIEKLEMITKST